MFVNIFESTLYLEGLWLTHPLARKYVFVSRKKIYILDLNISGKKTTKFSEGVSNANCIDRLSK